VYPRRLPEVSRLTWENAAGYASGVPINVNSCFARPTRAVNGNFGSVIPSVAGSANVIHRVVAHATSWVSLTSALVGNSGVTALGPAIDANGDTLFLPYAWDTIYSMELPAPAIAAGNGTTSFLTADMSGCKVFVDPIVGGNGAVVVHHANNVSNPPPPQSLPNVETPACTGFLDNLHTEAVTYYQGAPHNLNLNLAGTRSIDKTNYNASPTVEVQLKQGQHRKNVVFAGGTMVFGMVNGAKWDFYWVTWGSLEYDRPIYAPKILKEGFHHNPDEGRGFQVLGYRRFF
jgi:hypothetical protein